MELILAILVLQYLRRTMQTASQLPKWDRIFKYIIGAAVVLIVIGVSKSPIQPLANWLSHLLVLYIVYILYKESVFHSARPVLLAIAPYLILSLFNDITKLVDNSLFSTLHSMLKTAMTFAFIWMGVMLIITNNQRKALERERKNTAFQKEQNKITGQLKEQLEVQVAERTAALTQQKEEPENTLKELKATQAQLIQSEKMASLGELTAGIAHEIQNPLNFVNNFAEVSNELIEELETEREKPLTERDPQLETEILRDISQNLEKINFHGKRADAIVKGMLQHSRSSSGTKEPTDLNNLADEYLRLTYHGLRAKDKSFNASMKTDFDTSIEKINIIPQDIGRVLLNLLTNAFYAVWEKKKRFNSGYEPLVIISTKKRNDKIEVTVRDNGMGIPQEVKDKIFQPFFTTKPTGEGTGLGLSLSYDIVRAHGGEIQVNTEEGEGTAFILLLPMHS